jgi:hypothetical protein
MFQQYLFYAFSAHRLQLSHNFAYFHLYPQLNSKII